METDYEVGEIKDASPGEPHWEIHAPMKDSPIAKSLIAAGVLGECDDLTFFLQNGKPHIKFRTDSSNPLFVWPKIHQAESILRRAIRDAERLEKVMKAIEMAKKNG